jgi:hypothetical protein
MRLLRYQGSREIWACRACGAETPLLDCHCCERRGVHLAVVRAGFEPVWDCDFCGNRKRQCAQCGKGWMTNRSEGPAVCSSCGRQGIEPGS